MATTARVDPVRNFKFNVEASLAGNNTVLGDMGFMSVEGIAMNTEMVAYREGGWNTSPHKLPGQTDFSPLTMSAGVFHTKPHMWNLAKRMFNVQWGGLDGLSMDANGDISEFRYDLIVRVMGHPVTAAGADGVARNGSPEGSNNISGAILAYKFFNCWTASVGFSGLNASDNAIIVHQMTVHHEGFQVYFGNTDAVAAA